MGLASYGCNVVLHSRDTRGTDSLAADLRATGVQVIQVAAELSDIAQVDAMLAQVLGHTPGIDIVYNNAAIMTPYRSDWQYIPVEDFERSFAVNVIALIHICHGLIPGMVARGRGHVCIIGSTAGRNTFVGGTCYTGTKHFVMGFAESLMLEVRDAGVGVSVITPGSVATELFPAGTNTTWMLEPDNVAAAVAFAVTTPQHMLVHRLEVRPLSPKRPRSGT